MSHYRDLVGGIAFFFFEGLVYWKKASWSAKHFKTIDPPSPLKVSSADVLTNEILILENPHSTSVLLKKGENLGRVGKRNHTVWYSFNKMGGFLSLFIKCVFKNHQFCTLFVELSVRYAHSLSLKKNVE